MYIETIDLTIYDADANKTIDVTVTQSDGFLVVMICAFMRDSDVAIESAINLPVSTQTATPVRLNHGCIRHQGVFISGVHFSGCGAGL